MRAVRAFGSEATILAVAVFGLVLGQYLTVSLPFRRSLEARAVLVLIFTSAPLIVGLRRRGWRQRIQNTPTPVIGGVIMWAAATGLGTIVALIRGNELFLVAGQLFSMGLLPFAFVAARSVDVENRPRVFSNALVAAGVVACLLQFGYWASRSLTGKPLLRLALPNSLSFVGVSIMALILAFALAIRGDGLRKALGMFAVPLIGIYIVGSGTRSVVLAAVLGVAVLLVVVGTSRKGLKGLAIVTALVVTTGFAVFGGLVAIWNAPRRSVMPMESFLAPFWVPPSNGQLEISNGAEGVQMEIVWKPGNQKRSNWISLPYPVDPSGMYRVSVEMKGEGMGSGWIDVVSLTSSLEECTVLRFWAEAGKGWRRREAALLPEYSGIPLIRIRVGGREGANGTWRVRNFRLEQYSLIVPRSLQRHMVFLYDHIVTSWAMFRSGKMHRDPSMRVRIKEMKAARDQVENAPLPIKIFGHGLGARLEFEEPGFNALGERIVFKDPNYIHNFYAFLPLKLGAVGGLAILIALGAWIFRSFQMIIQAGRGWGVEPGAASLAVWIAYAAWGVFCPQLIDFADAPIFGFFLACWVAAEHTFRPTPE